MKRRHLLQLLPLALLAACDRWRVSAPTIQQPTSALRLLPTVGSTATAQVVRWANRMADSVMARRPTLLGRWHYELGFMMRAFELLWREGQRASYLDYVLYNVSPLVDAEGQLLGYRQEDYKLDQIAGGRTLLFLYDHSGEERYLRAATLLREQLRIQPRTPEGGFWHKGIYPQQMWLDGLYMAAPFYAAWAHAFGESSAWDDVTLQFNLIGRHLRDQRTGLYYHGWDASRTQLWADPTTGRSPNFWGRSVGWLAMALVEVIEIMPADRPQRAQLTAMWRSLADALIDVQDPATGLWWQVLDQGGRAGNYHEASASCMFVYALARSARMGDLDEKHLAVARRGYEGIVSYLVQVDDRGLVNLNGICRMAGLGGDAGRDGSFAYYVSEPVVANDDKGVAAFILASVEIERVS